MNIVFDYDDTLVPFLPALIEFHNDIYGTNLKKDDFHSYNFWEVWGGTKEQAIEKVEEFFVSSYYYNIKAEEKAQEFVHELKRHNNLYIATGRPLSAAKSTHESVNKLFPNSFKKIFICNRYGLSGEYKTKKSVCDLVNADVMIEDSIDYADECVQEGRLVFLRKQPWNINKTAKKEVIRVNEYDDISSVLRNFSVPSRKYL